MGQYLSPRYSDMILVSGYHFDSCQFITVWMCNDEQYQVAPGLPNLVRKWEIKHWFPCGADRQSVVSVWSHDYQIFWDG